MRKKWLIFLRIFLAILIALNLAAIFGFSGENAEKSTQTSSEVTQKIAEITVPDFEEKPAEEQEQIVKKMDPPIRKIAHMTEYASLGALIFLFLLTWNGAVLWKYLGAIGFSALYAVTDELHQKFSFGRAASVLDFSIDTAGALLACSLLLLIRFWVLRAQARPQRAKKKITTLYTLPAKGLSKSIRLAVVADLHGNPPGDLTQRLRESHPDAILIPGDLSDYKAIARGETEIYDFLTDCVSIAPTFYSLGNHEIGAAKYGNPFATPHKKEMPPEFTERVANTGATLLRDDCVRFGELWICGLESGSDGTKNEPDQKALAKFAACDGFRVLLCHHPEYYTSYIHQTDIDLTVCGHAHGGQWRFFGRGVYSPNQGLFPKYTSGVLEGRCVISRGLGDHTWIPRINNPRELVLVDLKKD